MGQIIYRNTFILLPPDSEIRITVGRNEVKILDSRHRSSISVGKYQGPIREQGGRTMVSVLLDYVCIHHLVFTNE